MLSESAVPATEIMLRRYINRMGGVSSDVIKNMKIEIPRLHEKMISSSDMSSESGNPFDAYEDNSVVVIPMIGFMSKYSHIDWDEYRYVVGMDVIADLMKKAFESKKISGIVILANTPGGSTHSIYRLEDVLRNRTKPCVGVIDGMCFSGGIYTLSFCDKILATNRMCEVGSIGTFARIIDNSKMLENAGITVESIYPPESKWKNKAIREAMDGKPQLLIDESLTPFALHFQNIIKENRPKLDTSVEGILEGREFYAYDAIDSKLIDGIGNVDAAIVEVQRLADKQKQFYSQFK